MKLQPENEYGNFCGGYYCSEDSGHIDCNHPVAMLEDTDPMPFGKYQGTPMQDVPASYLHWLWTNGKKEDRQCPVADYIRRNLNSLKLEHKDGIWS